MTPREHALSMLRFARKTFHEMLKGWPEDKFTFQTTPADNHPVWCMGHLALTEQWIAGLVGAKVDVPKAYNEFFGMGTKPVNDARKYPPAAEVRRVFDDSRQAIIAWLEKAPDAALAVPLSEKTGGFTTDPIDAMFKIAWHEGWHMGQIATLRKALGLPSIMG